MKWYIIVIALVVFVTALPIFLAAKKGPAKVDCAPSYFIRGGVALEKCKVRLLV